MGVCQRVALRAFLASTCLATPAAALAQAPASEADLVAELVVTAQKRSERLLEVPVPVTAITAQSLIESNQLRLQDYFASIPGFTAAPSSVQGAQVLSIRGISTGATYALGGGGPTVGVMIDEIPFGSSTFLGQGQALPDIDPSDLARVEVLRGPQGTLYGASSMGGLIQFVTVDPSVNDYSGRVEAGATQTKHGGDFGYQLRGSVNVPLGERVALRASAFKREEPGYIDNEVRGVADLNSQDYYGGRLSLLAQLTDDVSLKLAAFVQRSRADGASDSDGRLGYLEQNNLPGTGYLNRHTQAFNATLRAKLGGIDLVSLTGYNTNKYTDSFDATFVVGSLAQLVFGQPYSPVFDQSKTNKFTQEVRASGALTDHIDALAGVFYTKEDSLSTQQFTASDALNTRIVGVGLDITVPSTYKELAGFVDVTLKASERFDLQIGGRYSDIEQTRGQLQVGPYVPLLNRGQESPFVFPTTGLKARPITYLVTPRFRLSPDAMIYARFASGFRPGGINSPATPQLVYDPDRTYNYEVGTKGKLLGGALTYDASIYRIDWKGIQLGLLDTVTRFQYTSNAGRARSQGAEFTLSATPTHGLRINASGSYNDAELAADFPAGSTKAGRKGDQLPYSARYTGSLSFDQSFPMGDDWDGRVGATLSYVDKRKGVFNATAVRQKLPAYTTLDLRAGLEHDGWMLNAFATNVTNTQGLLNGGLGQSLPFAFVYIRPRTVGMSVAKAF